MSSNRSSPSAMDADVEESAPPSPPGSTKRPSPSPKGAAQSSPNPSPGASPAAAGKGDRKRRKLRTSAESAALALASVAAHASAADADRGAAPKRRDGPLDVPVDDGHGAIQMLGAAAARVDRGHQTAAQKRGGPAKAEGPVTRRRAGKQLGAAPAPRGGAAQKLWSYADEFTLLNAALEFRKRTGRVPRLPDMTEFFTDITDLISPEIDQWMVYYKLKRLKSKYQHTDGPSDRRLRGLCASLWGFPSYDDISDGETDADGRRPAPDAAAMMPVVAEVLGEYWNTNSRAMGGLPLEKGLSRLGKKQGRVLEIKWRQQLDEEMQTQMKRHDLAKEVCSLLSGAIKGLGP